MDGIVICRAVIFEAFEVPVQFADETNARDVVGNPGGIVGIRREVAVLRSARIGLTSDGPVPRPASGLVGRRVVVADLKGMRSYIDGIARIMGVHPEGPIYDAMGDKSAQEMTQQLFDVIMPKRQKA